MTLFYKLTFIKLVQANFTAFMLTAAKHIKIFFSSQICYQGPCLSNQKAVEIKVCLGRELLSGNSILITSPPPPLKCKHGHYSLWKFEELLLISYV